MAFFLREKKCRCVSITGDTFLALRTPYFCHTSPCPFWWVSAIPSRSTNPSLQFILCVFFYDCIHKSCSYLHFIWERIKNLSPWSQLKWKLKNLLLDKTESQLSLCLCHLVVSDNQEELLFLLAEMLMSVGAEIESRIYTCQWKACFSTGFSKHGVFWSVWVILQLSLGNALHKLQGLHSTHKKAALSVMSVMILCCLMLRRGMALTLAWSNREVCLPCSALTSLTT